MPDLNTLLISVGGALAVYAGGVLTKPLQSWIDERRERANLRKALYVEMAGILSKYFYIVEQLRLDASLSNHWEVYVKGLWPDQCFELARGKPVVLNLLSDFAGINHFFRGLESLSEVYQITCKDQRSMSSFTVAFLTSVIATAAIIEDRELSKNELIKYGDEKAKKLLAGIPDLGNMILHFERLSNTNSRSSASPS